MFKSFKKTVKTMKIRFSRHALNRAKERSIDLKQIEEVLRNPTETIDVKFGRKASYRQYNDKFIVVIFEEHDDEIVVVTVLRVDKERLRGYGFSRV